MTEDPSGNTPDRPATPNDRVVSAPLRRAVFLDRDGVLNEVVERDGAPGSPRSEAEFRFVADIDTLRRLEDAGWLLFVITNQPDVARGHTDLSFLGSLMARLRSVAPIDDYRICPHEDADGCECRKPKPGMLLDLARCWHVDLAGSFVVGDMWRDVGAARAAGCTSILIQRPYNEGLEADARVTTLGAAVDLILGHHAL